MTLVEDLKIWEHKRDVVHNKVKSNTNKINGLKSGIAESERQIRQIELYNKIHRASLTFIDDKISYTEFLIEELRTA